MRPSLRLGSVMAVIAASAATGALPAEAAWSNKTLLTCTDPLSPKTAAMEVRTGPWSGAGGDMAYISSTSWVTDSSAGGFRAEEVRLMLRLNRLGDTTFMTINKWGDVSTANAVSASGTSNASTWPAQPLPILQQKVDELKLKVYENNHYLDCSQRKVGWVP